ncbi:MAG: hypothetical protein U0176_08015 [Bacteroidia bacterium]
MFDFATVNANGPVDREQQCHHRQHDLVVASLNSNPDVGWRA